ncbi:cysteine proteinase [Fomitiporia mediterranea MF3/22]|uniref:cysteine proteinase n=1 Tax=Fomitiporia mediterranea (strain MF3/22) TaxID=694068 RepID=UPI00044088FD|nr:cysteine proteinase [Fomitiporia mediterranea MF3/22]EJD04315.1 cysteine proteinase [Fomitiporia mediterranea MF3/22]
MSSSPQKRSASDAHLSTRPTKSARISFPTSTTRAKSNYSNRDSDANLTLRMSRQHEQQEEPSLTAKWSEVWVRSVDTACAVGDVVYATVSAAKNYINPWQWKAMFAFRDTDDASLPRHSADIDQSTTPPPETPATTQPSSVSPKKSPTTYSNNSPTNILASTSSSASSFYPPPPAPVSSSNSSSAEFSHVSASGTSSTRTSHPDSPPKSSNGVDSPTQNDSIRRLIAQSNQDGLRGSGVGKKYKRKSHIYEGQHRENVKEHLQRLLYDRTRAMGYKSDFETFRGYIQYRRRLEEIQKQDWKHSYAGSIGSRKSTPILPQDDVEFFRRAVEKATKSLHSPKPPKPFSPQLEELSKNVKFKSDRIQERLHPKRKPIPERLPSDAQKELNVILRKRGVVSKAGREQVSDTDLSRLGPGQWLNDEIINFYGQLIVDRAAEAEAAKENERNGKVLNVHYFSSFFWPKLQSGYEKGRLAKWTKKVDIFSKDIILMAVNHGNAHWTSAAIDFTRKRIISYDSMGFHRSDVYKALRMYLNEEHKNKKKKPFDFTGWEDYRSDMYPEQENGYDCGVFTCQTLEYLSRGEEEFNFTQQNMPYLRQRMIWEIGKAKLGDPL